MPWKIRNLSFVTAIQKIEKSYVIPQFWKLFFLRHCMPEFSLSPSKVIDSSSRPVALLLVAIAPFARNPLRATLHTDGA